VIKKINCSTSLVIGDVRRICSHGPMVPAEMVPYTMLGPGTCGVSHGAGT